MGVTRRPNSLNHTAAGDTSSENVKVRWLLWTGAALAADDLQVKNGAGTVLLAIKATATLGCHIEFPFGDVWVDGIESDVLDAGTVEYVLA